MDGCGGAEAGHCTGAGAHTQRPHLGQVFFLLLFLFLTSGRVLEQELGEWAAQARRWTIGAAEVQFIVFNCFAINIRFI